MKEALLAEGAAHAVPAGLQVLVLAAQQADRLQLIWGGACQPAGEEVCLQRTQHAFVTKQTSLEVPVLHHLVRIVHIF